MKQVFRYMSNKEHDMLLRGACIYNHTDHASYRGEASNAVGFCFGIGDKEQAIAASRWLDGIVIAQWLMLGTVDETFFHKATGRYVNHDDPEKPEMFKDELCRESIRLKYFKDVYFFSCRAISSKTHLVMVDYPRNETKMEIRTLEIANSIAAQTLYDKTAKDNNRDDDFSRHVRKPLNPESK